MVFDIITIFPESFDSYFNTSLLARAQAQGLIELNTWDLRYWTDDPHKTVDDRPYGGGAGMVMKVDVAAKAIKHLVPKKNKKTRVINLSAQGKPLSQKKVEELSSKYNRLVLLAGRYEGFDARVEHIVDEEISIGDYILTGGELPAMVLVDSISRLVPGVVGKEASIEEESFTSKKHLLEYPHYTRPEVFEWEGKKHKVPEVLLSGNHKEIKKWRRKQAEKRTKERRPDLLKSEARNPKHETNSND